MRKNLGKIEDYDRPWGVCIVAGFTLDLYCANTCNPHAIPKRTFQGKTKFIAFDEARKAGWVISERKNLAVCPNCVAEGKILGNAPLPEIEI